MTEEGERALLSEYLATCARLHAGFQSSGGRAAQALPIAPEDIDTLPFEIENAVLAFIKRFEQLEDALHRTMKLLAKLMEHGKIERLTSVDVTRRAYALGILADEKSWADAVRARNALAHEYPLNPAKRAEQSNGAWAQRDVLDATWQAIQNFVAVEKLL